MPEYQSVAAKAAESKRPFSGEKIVRDHQLAALHRKPAQTMLADLEALAANNVSFSPFLEIGAGSVQRSAALINHYSADGVATDISQQSLRDAPFTLSLFGYARAPMLICCDAHHLPFLSSTFQFIFAYQTLHHFGNPVPVVAECYRVLGKGGHFYFNEEPLDSPVRRVLRGNRLISYPPTRVQKAAYRLHIEKVFWDDGASERSVGIIEARYDIGLWRETLQPFKAVSVEVNRRLRFKSNLYKPVLTNLLASLAGGNIKGLCLKSDGEPAAGDFRERLMCLDCHAPILSRQEPLRCRNCGRSYPGDDGFIRMLPKELETQLFPTQ